MEKVIRWMFSISLWIETYMWRSSGVLYVPYIFRTLKRAYKPTIVISTKLLCPNMACVYREREWGWPERHLCVENETERLPQLILLINYSKVHLVWTHSGLAALTLKAVTYEIKPKRSRMFSQFEIIVNVLVSSFWFIWILMLCVYGDCK